MAQQRDGHLLKWLSEDPQVSGPQAKIVIILLPPLVPRDEAIF